MKQITAPVHPLAKTDLVALRALLRMRGATEFLKHSLISIALVRVRALKSGSLVHSRVARLGLLLLLLSRSLQAASIIQFSGAGYNAFEGMYQVELTVQRAEDLDTVVSVDLLTTNQTATAGSDYVELSTNLTFHAGETSLMVSVRILNDSLMEAREAFNVILSNPTGGAELGERSVATVRITDNDTGVQFDGATYQAREHDGSVLIGVLRGIDGDFPVTVEYATVDDTATAGKDYSPVSGRLDFAAGESVKLIRVPILNDGLKETNKTFRLYLTNATGTVLGPQQFTDVTVVDNDLGIHFEPNAHWVAEREGLVKLTVARGNDIELGAFTVDYATKNGNALAGDDYLETQGTLQFAEGEMSKVLTIPIVQDDVAEPDEQFTVILSNPTGKVDLPSTYATATVNIVESVEPWVADPRVAKVVAQVQPHDLLTLLSQVSGEECVLVGDDDYLISNRNTSSNPRASVWKATQLVYESLQALGLEVEYQGWKAGGYTNVNVVGTQAGESRSNEFVLVTAHLDNQPNSYVAPGADDNASGVVAVLTAARIFSQYRLDRSIQYVLFTGEEQYGPGSTAFAARAQAEARNLVGVINLDMVSWEPSFPPGCLLITRSNASSHPDFAIAYAFLKTAETHGLHSQLWPVPETNLSGFSDHASFWAHGYPAIALIEPSYESDPYYHTVNDTIRQVNLPYFTAVVQAALGTVAHLAQPKSERPLGILEVTTSDSVPYNGIGGARLYAKHVAGASEKEKEAFDLPWVDAPTNAMPQWLKISTEPYGAPLQTDARPLESETMFRTQLSVVDATGTGVSCRNRLGFGFLTPPDPERIYLARIHVDGRYVTGATDFDCVTNLQEVINADGFIDLPSLNQVPDGTVYGTCDLAVRSLDTQTTNCTLRLATVNDGSIVLMTRAQLGTRVIDDLEVNTHLAASTTWTHLKSYTNDVSPNATHFEAGWTEIAREFDASQLLVSDTWFFRIKRTWIVP